MTDEERQGIEQLKAIVATVTDTFDAIKVSYEQLKATLEDTIEAHNIHIEQATQLFDGAAARIRELDDRVSRLEHGGEWVDPPGLDHV